MKSNVSLVSLKQRKIPSNPLSSTSTSPFHPSQISSPCFLVRLIIDYYCTAGTNEAGLAREKHADGVDKPTLMLYSISFQ